jgi:hypothetical protein
MPQSHDPEEHFKYSGDGELIDHAVQLSREPLSLRLTDDPDCAALCVQRVTAGSRQ